ncbi:hypothetical protein EST38_g6157 [Candolleomyces aberdarensis]|uniref:Uncharacterized protein n=1 Tax=Candolleomyces aberdarensis TaxID=2316362 RepID=A0A4Q2DKG2_9AGAR|nr:hypothetical protein EST38_g6157 [Candolleomyces aberdarensis]
MGALVQRAWNDADKKMWERRKENLELDIEGNQALWPKLVRESLQQNLGRGVVGSAVVGLMYGFRTKSGGIQHGILYSGFDALENSELIHAPGAHSELLKLWSTHADSIMPGITEPSVFQFVKDDDGLPLLPSLDLAEVTVKQVSQLLRCYFSAVWEHVYPPENDMPTIPWLHISGTPDDFYDTTRFQLGINLGDPIPCKLADTLSLYERLLEHQSASNPFRFRSKGDIDERLKLAVQEVLDDIGKDDEDFEQGALGVAEKEKQKEAGPIVVFNKADLDKPLQEDAPQPPAASPPLIVHPLPPMSPPPPSTPPPFTPPAPSPPPDSPKPGSRRKGLKKVSRPIRELNDLVTNVQPSHDGSTGRKSTRKRKQAKFGPETAAGGQRSPRNRRSTWSYAESSQTAEDNQRAGDLPSKRRRIAQ